MKRLDTNPGLRMHGRLALMALTAILPLWIAIGIYAYQSYHSQRERLFEQALDMARIVSQRVDGELNGIMSALRALSTSPAFVSGDLATLHYQAEALVSFYPSRNAIVLIDDQEQLIMSTTRSFGSPLPRVGQPEVKAALEKRQAIITSSFISAVTSLPVISIIIPIEQKDKLGYTILMTAHVEEIGAILQSLSLPQQWTAAMVDANNKLIATSVDEPRELTGTVPIAIQDRINANKEGAFQRINSKGQIVYSVFTHSAKSGWTTVISVPVSIVEGDLKTWLYTALIGGLISTIVIVAVMVMISRKIITAGRKLEESEHRFSDMANSSPALISLMNEKGERYWFNQSWQKILPDSDQGDLDWLDYVHPTDRSQIVAAIAEGIKKREAWQFEYRLLLPDQTPLWIQDTVLPRWESDDKISGFICSAFDITKFKDAEIDLKRYGEIVDTSGDMLAYFDHDLICRMANVAYAGVFDCTPKNVIGKSYEQILGAELAASCRPFLEKALSGEKAQQIVGQNKFGKPNRIFSIEYYPFISKGETEGVVVNTEDITQRVASERMQRIAAVAFETQEAIVIAGEDGRIVQVNHAFTAMTGFKADNVAGQHPQMLVSERHAASFLRSCIRKILKNGSWQGELWIKRKNSDEFPILLTISAVTDERGFVSNFVGAFLDITERKETEEKILNLAFFDMLTDLPNRRLLLERLDRAILASKRNQHLGAVLFIDLDRFKELNDTLGHDYGDLLLIEVARRLEACVRESDTVARLGGDEFVILLEQLNDDKEIAINHTAHIGEKVLESLNQPYQLKEHVYQAGASIGATLFRDGVSSGELLKEADVAMYWAKKDGRNAFHFFDMSKIAPGHFSGPL